MMGQLSRVGTGALWDRFGNVVIEIGGWWRDLSPWTWTHNATIPSQALSSLFLRPFRRSLISNFALPPRQSMDEMWMICLLAFWLPIVRTPEAATAAALSQAPKNGWKNVQRGNLIFFCETAWKIAIGTGGQAKKNSW